MIIELSETEYLYLKRNVHRFPVIKKLICNNKIYVLEISEGDASDIREKIEDDLPSYFGTNNEPTSMLMIVESLIDKFDSNFLARVCYEDKQNNLRWKRSNEAVIDMYRLMQNIITDTTQLYAKPDNLLEVLLKRRAADKNHTPQKILMQERMKKYFDSNFVFVSGTVARMVFDDLEQIIEWGNSFKLIDPIIPTIIFYEEFQVLDFKFFLLMVKGAFMLHDISFYVFKKSGNRWLLQTESHLTSTEMLVKPEVDNSLKRVIFKTTFGQIGELPFEFLLSDSVPKSVSNN